MKSWTASLLVTLVFLANMMSAEGQVVAQGKPCGVLVTEQECHAYLGRLDHARTTEERMLIETAHVELLKERARLCPSQRAMHESEHAESIPSKRSPQRDIQVNPAPRVWM